MPSPFPGMDPYLAGKEWGSFHIELSSAVTRALIPELRPRYYARTMPRFITDWPEGATIVRRDIYPDVGVTLRETTVIWNSQTDARPLQLKTVIPQKISHYVVEIYDRENGDLVTAVEILSPANKRSKGYDEYVAKRERILQSSVLLDLPAVFTAVYDDSTEKSRRLRGLSRFYSTEICENSCNSCLFSVNSYDDLDYASLIDYSQPPEILLEGILNEWAKNHLQSVTSE